MAVKPIEAVCESCGHPFEAKPVKDWLGFQKVKCPECNHRGLYPLTNSYRKIYWVLVGFLILSSIGTLSQGGLPVPGLIALLAVLGLVKDARIRKEVAARASAAPD